jgi:hypothetical protein
VGLLPSEVPLQSLLQSLFPVEPEAYVKRVLKKVKIGSRLKGDKVKMQIIRRN